MYKNDLIEIPNEGKGKISKRKTKNYVQVMYVHDAGYNKETKKCSPKRTIIGKAEKLDSKEMTPNDNFYKIFGAKLNIAPPTFFCNRSGALKIGTYCVIEQVMDEYNLPKYLSEIIIDKNGFDMSGLLKDLVCYFIINESNEALMYPDYAFNHPLFSKKMHIYSDSTVSRYYRSLTTDFRLAFMAKWNNKRNKNARCYISYDSTNKNIRAGDISFAEWGHAKVDKGSKIFNMAIGFDTTNSVPLTYEIYSGSMADCSQLPVFLNTLKSNGYTNLGIILDRGYFTKANITSLETEYHYDYIIMIKGKERVINDLIANNTVHFENDYSYFIPEYGVFGIELKGKLFDDDTKKRNINLYFSTQKMAKEQQSLLNNIDNGKKTLDKIMSDPARNKEIYLDPKIANYFNIQYTKDHGILMYTENTQEINREMKSCGYFSLVTSENKTARDTLILYKGRDASEKLFNQDKTGLGADTERVHSDETLQGKIFIEFIALIVRNRIYNLLHTQKIKDGANYNYYDVPKAISELEKIEMIRQPDGVYNLGTVVTKRQRTILSCFGLDDTDILEKSKELSEKLKSLR